MNFYKLQVIRLPLLLFFLLQGESQAQVAEATHERIDALNLAAAHFQQNAEFKANFEFAFGKAGSWDEALSSAQSENSIVSGKLVKQNNMLLYEHDCNKKPFAPTRMLSVSGLQFMHNPIANRVQLIGPEAAGQSGNFLAWTDNALELSSFYQMGGKTSKLIDVPKKTDPEKVKITCEIETKQDQIFVEVITESLVVNAHSASSFVFNLIKGIPHLSQREFLVKQDGKTVTHSKVFLSDFVEGGKVSVASKVVRLMGPLAGATEGADFLFWRWESKNIGSDPVSSNDFFVEINNSTVLRDEWDYPASGQVTQEVMKSWYEKVKLKSGQTGDSFVKPLNPISPPEVVEPRGKYGGFWIVGIGLLFLTGLYFLLRPGRKQVALDDQLRKLS